MPGILRQQLEIRNELGLHLRAASRLVQLTRLYQSDVRVFWNGQVADGKSILDLIALGASYRAMLELELDGPDAEEAAVALQDLIANGFHDDGNGCDHAPPLPPQTDARLSTDAIA
jgi:phosphotransferase system HPr (HPr) family protein